MSAYSPAQQAKHQEQLLEQLGYQCTRNERAVLDGLRVQGKGKNAKTLELRSRVVGIEGLQSYAAYGPPETAPRYFSHRLLTPSPSPYVVTLGVGWRFDIRMDCVSHDA